MTADPGCLLIEAFAAAILAASKPLKAKA